MKKTAIFPGTFSPFTKGHEYIVKKSIKLFDTVIIAIGINSKKNNFFPQEERKKWVKSLYKKNKQIEVISYEKLTIDLCNEYSSKYIIRGIRDAQDFIYEKRIADFNREIDDTIETIFLLTPPNLSHISSTLVRDIKKRGGDIKHLIPKK
ncbi:MAG: pantetheine-phosphate adenylyltransferase [Flavobacteriales bacterium]|nr:pantetheine-phosphate adenylyltransferase [Flavobacteriales bacterium]